ncbi:WhiB family transcriptional regulator [Streptomyces scopuliridis]|uniref:WhiB family transcriptional regulator n=1 Tax=Streptomyces scopuliridis TaxID=452529 RepID=UPI003448776A
MTDPTTARQQLTDHKHYRYRGCAPDPDQPQQSAADPDVALDAWGPYTGDGAEPQRDRHARERAAMAICARCPVLAACRAYGNAVLVEGGVEHLAEPEGILGGELALTRHRALIARRHAATTATVSTAGASGSGTGADAAPSPKMRDLTGARTPQKRALLRALARETDTELVAYRAGMDVRSANWHRSALTAMLGLDKERATRAQLLATAVEHGLLPRSTRIRPDGPWPVAAAPTTDGIRQRRIEGRGRPVQLMLPGFEGMSRVHPAPALRPGGGCAPARRRARPPRLRLVRTPARRPVPLVLPFPVPARPATTVLESAA